MLHIHRIIPYRGNGIEEVAVRRSYRESFIFSLLLSCSCSPLPPLPPPPPPPPSSSSSFFFFFFFFFFFALFFAMATCLKSIFRRTQLCPLHSGYAYVGSEENPAFLLRYENLYDQHPLILLPVRTNVHIAMLVQMWSLISMMNWTAAVWPLFWLPVFFFSPLGRCCARLAMSEIFRLCRGNVEWGVMIL